MFGEAVKTFKSIKPLFLLATFITFSFVANNNNKFSLLEQPFSWWALLIPLITVGGFLFAKIWVELLFWIKYTMEDTFPIIPCALLVYAVLITFWFLANNPRSLNTPSTVWCGRMLNN